MKIHRILKKMNIFFFIPLITFIIFMSYDSFAKEKETLIFAFDPWPPYHETLNGKTEGVLIDIVKELFIIMIYYNIIYFYQRR